jgi:hypothetical protein
VFAWRVPVVLDTTFLPKKAQKAGRNLFAASLDKSNATGIVTWMNGP